MSVIHDSVHGHIQLTPEEMSIINHPLFQRLRRICQLALLHYVWPTASHKRFEHSIGACHMAQQMLNALETRDDKLYPLSEAESGQAVRYYELDKELRDKLTRLTRIAALIHDLGHGPMSHAFDGFAPKFVDIKPLLDDARLQPIHQLTTHIKEAEDETHTRADHELISCILFAKLWADVGNEPWISQAVAVILLKGDAAGSDIPTDLIPWLPLVRDIISSTPIDADRMDYLLRDSKSLGVSYGLYDPDRVLKSMLCVRMNGQYRLGWRHSGIRAIENFIASRFFMFAQCYTHKTERTIGLMLIEIQKEANKIGLKIIRTDSLDQLAADYAALSDESFLRQLSGTNQPNSERLVHVAEGVFNRHLWTRLHDFEKDELVLTTRVLEAMQQRYPEEHFLLDTVSIKAIKEKDIQTITPLLWQDREGRYSISESRSWLEASEIMKTFHKEEQSKVRLFMEMKTPDREYAKKLRVETVKLVSELREATSQPE
ncbi:MAG: hypothetical protein WCK01_03090 [Candidatus Uhrbacteria bacterium]